MGRWNVGSVSVRSVAGRRSVYWWAASACAGHSKGIEPQCDQPRVSCTSRQGGFVPSRIFGGQGATCTIVHIISCTPMPLLPRGLTWGSWHGGLVRGAFVQDWHCAPLLVSIVYAGTRQVARSLSRNWMSTLSASVLHLFYICHCWECGSRSIAAAAPITWALMQDFLVRLICMAIGNYRRAQCRPLGS